jgi:hypothetical protein
METTTINLSWLCLVVPIGIMIVVAVLGTRSKLQYANRIREAQARGSFADMSTPEAKSRFRRLGALALIGVVGMVLSFVIFVFQRLSGVLAFSGVTITAAVVFGIIGATAGLLMQREIDRRL